MKRLFPAYLLFPISIFSSMEVVGQFVNVPTKISTPNGTITIPLPQYAPWMRYNFINNNINKADATGIKYKFYILFTNDSLVQAKARINFGDSINRLEWQKKDKKFSVKPGDTKEIYRFDDLGRKISGIPHDSTCWLFLVKTGKIKTYSINSDNEFPIIAYIQKGDDGPILPLTTENLLGMVADKEKAINLLRKDKLLKAIDFYNQE